MFPLGCVYFTNTQSEFTVTGEVEEMSGMMKQKCIASSTLYKSHAKLTESFHMCNLATVPRIPAALFVMADKLVRAQEKPNVYDSVSKLLLKNLSSCTFLRSEPWDSMSRGEQGKQHAWEPVGHSTLTDWRKYSGNLTFFKFIIIILL